MMQVNAVGGTPFPQKVLVQFGNWKGEGNSQEEALEQVREKSYQSVMAHELDHANAAGDLVAGPIQLTRNGQGIVVAGSVPIRFGFNAKDPVKSLSDAQRAEKAALAPHAPSTQDAKVAAQARAIQAQSLQVMAVQGMAQVAIQNQSVPSQQKRVVSA
jgi:hypothetical protein